MTDRENRFRETEQRLWESLDLTPTERLLELPLGVRVRVQELGDGAPLLFVHGTGSSGVVWAPLIAKLTSTGGFRCIVMDRPGCGLSEPVNNGEAFQTTAEFNSYVDRLIPEAIRALGLSQVPVVATSFGSYFTIRGASVSPELFEKIVAVAYVFGAPMSGIPMSMRFASIPGMDAMTAKIPPTKPIVKMILKQLGLKPALDDGRFSDEMFGSFLSVLRDTDTMTNESASPKLISPIRGQNPDVVLDATTISRVTVPVLFVWGDRDPMGGPGVAQSFAAKFADARLEMVADSGHAPWIDEPDLIAQQTVDFLNLSTEY